MIAPLVANPRILVDLTRYDLVVVNSSAGKDSQCMLDVIMELRRLEPSDIPVHVVHADLGRMEWAGTKELVRKQADYYGVPHHITARRRANGDGDTLLEYARRRGKWMGYGARWCTSDFKRGPCGNVIRRLANDLDKDNVRVLNCLGFRAQESPKRRDRPQLQLNKKLSCQKREVWDWLPIHDFTEDLVWQRIKNSGAPYHEAYDLGMPRLSCCFCIYAPRSALILAGKHNPELLDEYVQVETEIGHDFTQDIAIRDIRRAIDEGEEPGEMDGNWNM